MAFLTPDEINRRDYSAQINRYLSVGLWDSEAKLVESFFSPGGRILDIGCGAGRTTVALAKMGFQVTAVDMLPEMVDAAAGQIADSGVDVELHVMNACELAFPTGAFDGALFSFNGFENILSHERREAAIRSVWRILRPGAHFILTARSGAAFPKRWLGWVWMAFRQLILRPLQLSNPNLRLGDMASSPW